MQRNMVGSVLIAAMLLLFAGASIASEGKPGAEGNKAGGKAKTVDDRGAVKKKTDAPAKAQPVDINSASKAQLKSLPGVDDALADKIIAGRPYLSKSDLIGNKIVSQVTYDGLKTQVVAKQNAATAAKVEKLKREQAGK